jgi:hypothetical protein
MKDRINILLFLSFFICLGHISAQDTLRSIADTVAIDTAMLGKTKEFDDQTARKGKIFWDSHIRLRHEFWNNQEDLNDDLDDLYSFTRLKLYLGGGFRPSKNTEIYARFINESRYYGHKGTSDTINNDHLWRPERHYFEIVIGQLYFKWKNIANDHLDITLGRQNLHDKGFGNQWLIGDGTPLDGSKTFYYNSLRLTYRFNKYTSIDLVGLASFAEDPMVLYSQAEKSVTNITDEQGGWIWFKHRMNPKFPYHAYYIYKHENGGGGFQRQETSNIHTFGFHIMPESEYLWLDAQMAVQAGEYGQVSRSGIGTILYGGYQYKGHKWSLKAGPWYMYLSGDNPATEKFEAFNNLFGGYPNDDELYLNTWMRESGTSMWTNINLYGAFLEYMPTPKYNIRLWYHLMRANQIVTGDFFGTRKNRGHMIMLKAMGEFGERFKAYYMFEYLWPGDFYFNGADNAILSRINLEWHF